MGGAISGSAALDAALIAVSVFNAILLFWLGLTVLLNAERRTWAIRLAGGALVAGGIFFLIHTGILGRGIDVSQQDLGLPWRIGGIAVVALPFAWYAVMLEYSGCWDAPPSRLRRRHRLWLPAASLLTIVLAGLLALGNPLAWLTSSAKAAGISPFRAPLLFLFPLTILLSISLALDTLCRPAPSDRMMGDVARRRARPWLAATSVFLLLVSLVVTWALFRIVRKAPAHTLAGVYAALQSLLSWSDLAASALIALAVLSLGQAIGAYEVFTGKALPRRGFLRHWRGAVGLALGFGLVVGGSLGFQVQPLYSLLLATLLMTVFYALVSWRSYVERDRAIAGLRPFVRSEHLYERLLDVSPVGPTDMDARTPFRALCAQVLGTRRAVLAAAGPMAALTGPALSYPDERTGDMPWLAALMERLAAAPRWGEPLDPAESSGFCWALPLRSERGLIGALILDEKQDGAPYTQEEMEAAQATGERLIDAQAGAEMARRLMSLQRRRLAEDQVLDRRTRRTLHDEVLPQIHAVLLELAGPKRIGGACAAPKLLVMLGDAHRRISDLLRDLPPATGPKIARLGLLGALREAVETEFAPCFDGVAWDIDPQSETAIGRVPAHSAEVLFYAAREAVRNAARHGRGSDARRPLNLRVAAAWDAGLRLSVEDDGVGCGSQPADGHGLALHSTLMAVIGGSLALESEPNEGTRVRLLLPEGAL